MTGKYRKLRKSARLKQLAVPLLIITLAFIAIVYTTVNIVWNSYLIDAQSRVEGSVNSIVKDVAVTAEANRVTDNYINHHIRSSCKTIAETTDYTSNAELAKIAQTLNVAFINVYDKNNTIMASTEPFHIGLVVGPEHIAAIMNSDENSAQYLVENNRASAITGNEYRFGYYKAADGHIVQAGLSTADLAPYISANAISDAIEKHAEQHNIIDISHELNWPGLTAVAEIQDGVTIEGITAKLGTGTRVYMVQTSVNLPQLSGSLNITYDITSAYATAQKHVLYILAALMTVYIALIVSIALHYKKTKRRLYLTYYDDVTGLPNETSLADKINQIINSPARTQHAVTILGISDLDMAKLKYGNEVSEKIIDHAAEILQTIENDRLACFRHKQHGIALLTSTYTPSDLSKIYAGVSSMFNQPFILGDNKFYISAQYGTCMIDGGITTADQVIRNAAIALSSKNITSEPDKHMVYHDGLNLALYREEKIEEELHEIIQNPDSEAFMLHFQPMHRTGSKELYGFEALARMDSAVFGRVPPSEFIKIAEDKRLIIPLGQIILERACEFALRLNMERQDVIRISVNVSIIQMLEDDYVQMVKDTLDMTGVTDQMIVFEVTETVLASNYEKINHVIRQLKDIGVQTLMDDFGTGYSSFIRLNELHISGIKIDKYFIDKIKGSQDKSSIIADIISMAHKAGIYVIAEGVESRQQKEYLTQVGCDIVQGYYLGKPMHANRAYLYFCNTKYKQQLETRSAGTS